MASGGRTFKSISDSASLISSGIFSSVAHDGWGQDSLIETPARVSFGVGGWPVMGKYATRVVPPFYSIVDEQVVVEFVTLVVLLLSPSVRRRVMVVSATRVAASFSSSFKRRLLVGLMAFPSVVEFK